MVAIGLAKAHPNHTHAGMPGLHGLSVDKLHDIPAVQDKKGNYEVANLNTVAIWQFKIYFTICL